MRKRIWTDEEFVTTVKESLSYAQVLQRLHLRIAGSNYDTVKRKIAELLLNSITSMPFAMTNAWKTSNSSAPTATP